MKNNKRSQKENVMYHLMNIGPITPLEALNLYGIFRLGAIIHTLRHKHNMEIKTKISDGDKNYAVYSWERLKVLSDKDIENHQEGFGFKVKTKYDGVMPD
tara:strand:+ start:172 stop:471 length:300 start_codon:yes stop_codon:yes gene_type:complete